MNQSELMQRFVTGQFDGHMKPVGDLHIMYDGWGGKLMYNGQEIASRDVAYDKEADEYITREIWLVANIHLPTREHRAANKLRSVMDDLGYRFTGETSEVEVRFPHVKHVARIEVFRHPDGATRKDTDVNKTELMRQVVVDVKPLDEDDWQGLVEQALDAGSGNMTVRRRNGNPDQYAVTILNDDGSIEMYGAVHRDELMRVMVYMGKFDLHQMFEEKFTQVVIDLGQIDIWDASNIFQIAAFGDVIIS